MIRTITALVLLFASTTASLEQNWLLGSSGSNGGPNTVGAGSSKFTPLTPCAAGQLDFSDVTGCNLTFYMIGIR